MGKADKIKVGERIKQVRKKLGMNQSEFGRNLDEISPIRQSTVREWEAGNNFPSMERIIKIAKLGNVSIDYLVTGSESTIIQIPQKIAKKIDQILLETRKWSKAFEKLRDISRFDSDYKIWKSKVEKPFNICIAYLNPLTRPFVEVIDD